jgi:transcriptional regulator with XRE-family HTH domain
MLQITMVNEIDRLLREGNLSQRQIALRMGVSRGIVSAIASGRRGLYGKETYQIHSKLIRTSAPSRCPDCGYRVYMPCRICTARKLQQRKILINILAAEAKRNSARGKADSVISALRRPGGQSRAG